MLVCAAVALALGFWRVDRNALFGSEAISFYAAHLDLSHLFRMLHHVDAVHGLYYFFLHFWMSGSTSIVWMRVPSVFAVAVAAALVALLGSRLVSPRVGLLAGLVFALSPFVMEYAQDGRSYAFVAALVATTMLTLERAVRDSRPATWARYAIALALSGFMHEFALLAGVGFAITVLVARAGRRVLVPWLIATVVAWLAVTPLIIFSSTQVGAIGYLTHPTGASLRQLALQYFGPDAGVAFATILLSLVALTGIGSRRGRLDAAGLALPLVIIPPALLFVASLGERSYFDRRYFAYGMVGVALLVATGADIVARFVVEQVRPDAAREARSLRRLGPISLLVCLVAAVVLAVSQWSAQLQIRTVGSRLQDFTGPSVYLAHHARLGDAVLFSQPRSRAGIDAYPQDYAQLDDLSLAESPARSGSLYGLQRRPAQVRAALTGYDRVWVVSQCGYSPPTRVDTGGPFGRLHHDFRRVGSKWFYGVCLALFQRDTSGSQ